MDSDWMVRRRKASAKVISIFLDHFQVVLLNEWMGRIGNRLGEEEMDGC